MGECSRKSWTLWLIENMCLKICETNLLDDLIHEIIKNIFKSLPTNILIPLNIIAFFKVFRFNLRFNFVLNYIFLCSFFQFICNIVFPNMFSHSTSLHCVTLQVGLIKFPHPCLWFQWFLKMGLEFLNIYYLFSLLFNFQNSLKYTVIFSFFWLSVIYKFQISIQYIVVYILNIQIIIKYFPLADK